MPATRFRIPVMALVATETSDRRIFDDFTWRTPPLPLMWQRQDAHGPQFDSPPTVQVGVIDTISKTGNTITGEGALLDDSDTPPQDVVDFADFARQASRVGISVDASATEYYVEVNPEEAWAWMEAERLHADGDAADSGDGETQEIKIESERVRFPTAEIMGATCVAFPAFAGAYLELDGQPVPADQVPPVEQQAASVHVIDPTEDCAPCAAEADGQAIAIAASGGPVLPPRSYFEVPEADRPTALVVTDDGRLYGHAALWNSCHTGYAGQCVRPPRSGLSYGVFHTGYVRTAEGDDVPVGHVTMGTTHAALDLSAAQAMGHYDNTGLAVADVVAVNGKHGIWLSGALRPGVTDEQVRALRASPMSGDWRRYGSGMEMIAVLAVNTPGFPVPRARVASGAPLAIVAAGGMPARKSHGSERVAVSRVQVDLDAIANAVAAKLRADAEAATRREQVRARHRQLIGS